jgi:antitoxin (DNA-binding transcriptional repressor) of toxin-antitoxin stability system
MGFLPAGKRKWVKKRLDGTMEVIYFATLLEPDSKRNVLAMTTLTLDEAQQRLSDAVERALKGEEVAIKVGRETVRLVHDVPIRPPGYFAECYHNAEDAAFEERVSRDSKPTLEE